MLFDYGTGNGIERNQRMGNRVQGRVRISQSQIIQLVSQLSGLSQKECRTVLTDYAAVLRDCCMNGIEVAIPEIGVLTCKYKGYKESRMMHNVSTGKWEPTNVREEHNLPAFRMYSSFVEEMRDNTWGDPVYRPQGLDQLDNNEGEADELGGECDE